MTATYGDLILGFIRREYSPFRNAAKLLGRAAGVSPRTAENYLRGTHAPSGEALINLLAECETLGAELNNLVAERRASRERP